LNYDVPGSKCYGEGGRVRNEETDMFDILSDAEIQANCAKYGRLYDWATAMALDASCNSTKCATSTPHRGICPAGWHISTERDWEVFTSPGCYYFWTCEDAGTKIKASTGWDIGAGTDYYGFSALPGGHFNFFYYGGAFIKIGSQAWWWTADQSDDGRHADESGVYDDLGSGQGSRQEKTELKSVRCVKDD